MEDENHVRRAFVVNPQRFPRDQLLLPDTCVLSIMFWEKRKRGQKAYPPYYLRQIAQSYIYGYDKQGRYHDWSKIEDK